jgi:hypothetical protein
MNACTGNVCVDCCRCETCGRRVGTRHLDACACGPEQRHWYCQDCNAHRIASAFAPYAGRSGPDDWPERRDALPDLVAGWTPPGGTDG